MIALEALKSTGGHLVDYLLPPTKEYVNQLQQIAPERLVERMKSLQVRSRTFSELSWALMTVSFTSIGLALTGVIQEFRATDYIPAILNTGLFGFTFGHISYISTWRLHQVNNEVERRLLNE